VDRFFWEKRNKNISNGNLKKKKKKSFLNKSSISVRVSNRQSSVSLKKLLPHKQKIKTCADGADGTHTNTRATYY
jgi:hypothetical protein